MKQSHYATETQKIHRDQYVWSQGNFATQFCYNYLSI